MAKQREEKIVHEILPMDVLHGRGKSVHHHVGNVEFRRIVKAKALDYQRLTGMEKDGVAQQVIQSIENRGGRFLRPAGGDGSQWSKCPYHMVRTKVKQALRDILKIKSPRKLLLHVTQRNPTSKSQKAAIAEECIEDNATGGTVSEMAGRKPHTTSDMLHNGLSVNPRGLDILQQPNVPFQVGSSLLRGVASVPVQPNVLMAPPQFLPQTIGLLDRPHPSPLPLSGLIDPVYRFDDTNLLLRTYIHLQEQQQHNNTRNGISALVNDIHVTEILRGLRQQQDQQTPR